MREKPGNNNLKHYANYNTFASMLFNKCDALKPHLVSVADFNSIAVTADANPACTTAFTQDFKHSLL